MNNLRDVIRGWREALNDKAEGVSEIGDKLKILADAAGQKGKITKKELAKQLHTLVDETSNMRSDIFEVTNDMDDAARGKINDKYQPKIIRRPHVTGTMLSKK